MKNIKFEKNGKIFNLKAIVCENKDLIKFMNRDYFLNLCKTGCPNFNTNWSCPPNSPRFDEFVKDYKNSLLVELTSEVEDGEEFMEAYAENRNTLEALLSKMQIDFECLKTSCGSCNICERCAFLDNPPTTRRSKPSSPTSTTTSTPTSPSTRSPAKSI